VLLTFEELPVVTEAHRILIVPTSGRQMSSAVFISRYYCVCLV